MRRGTFSGVLFIKNRIRNEAFMKNWKRYGALLGVVLLLLVFAMPMYFALKGDFSQKAFMASLFTVLFVSVMAYVIWMLYRYLNKKSNKEAEGMIKNVIFDVGCVLVDFDWKGYIDGFHFPEEKKERIINATFKGPVWDERDRGCLEEEEYVRQCVALAPEYEADIREVMRRTPETIHRLPYSETWAKYLKSRGYHLYILSNYSAYMRDRNKKEMTFLKYMDGTVFSCDVKMLKPEHQIYEKVLEQFSLKAEESVFIDDRPENCQGAREVGIRAIEFKNFKQVTEELEKLGVK